MSNWAVFLTADRTSFKALNRALLLLQDFEFSEYPQDIRWVLLSSKELPSTPAKATTLPVSDTSSNAFASMSFVDINTFVRANETALQAAEISASDWLIIDQKGLETSTCLVCEQYYKGEDEEDGEEGGLTNEFRACRIPYEQAWGMISNLDIANMGFEDYVDEDAGEQEDGSWKWVSFDGDASDEKSEYETKREKALQELRDHGYAD
ncbi:hypothetical protein DFH07DRAFT_944009 [Mycena maculata]|uniref:DUF6924 domain-containing protein n=1 Tax=Mycena maculata TaxID=230809 RepID=A0AAD7IB54_9AGAR|nr:hypothetical protein DFH07DRAFT_944009 [Mycena maculata]